MVVGLPSTDYRQKQNNNLILTHRDGLCVSELEKL